MGEALFIDFPLLSYWCTIYPMSNANIQWGGVSFIAAVAPWQPQKPQRKTMQELILLVYEFPNLHTSSAGNKRFNQQKQSGSNINFKVWWSDPGQ